MSENPTKDMESMLAHYLATNPVVKTNNAMSELEVRFGTNPKKGKHISKVEYDNVIAKLLSCGFTCANMQGSTMMRINTEYIDKQTGLTKMSNIRAEIVGAELVQQYCRTNSIKKLMDMPVNNDYKMKFTQKTQAFTKDGEPIKKVSFPDFNFSVSYNMERDYDVKSKNVEDTMRNWTDSRKTFRLINRVRFVKADSPIAVDLSIIRNSRTSGGVMVPTHTMEESGIFTNQEHCEIELEVENSRVGVGTKYTEANVKELANELRSVIRVILSGIQGTNFPVSYAEQDEVLHAYMKLVHGLPEGSEPRRVLPRDFIGPSSCTLQLKNVVEPDTNTVEPNIRKNYCVTDKADGERKLLYVSGKDGKMFLINTNMLVQFTGCIASDKTTWNSLFDGEHIKYDNKKNFINTYAAFDLYYMAGKSTRELDFAPTEALIDEDSKKQYRLPLLVKLTKQLKPESVLRNGKPAEFKMQVKKFYPGAANIFDACRTVLQDVNDNVYPYMTDGLIFTPMNTGVGGAQSGQTSKLEKITWPLSFKWKPPHFNTIDFLVTYKKDADGRDVIHTTMDSAMYRTIELRCGFDKVMHGYINPFQDLLDGKYGTGQKNSDEEERYTPMPFQPTNPHDATTYLANVHCVNSQMITEEGDRFEENMIVEFSYNPDGERGWRWIPLRVRHDKTYNLRAGNREYGNAYHVANDNWKSIHFPVTEAMLTTGQDIPTADSADDVYYNKGKNDQVSYTRALRNFHNLYVKRRLIDGVSKKGDTLIDYAVGKAGDLSKWKYAGLRFVFGIDVSKDNIYNQLNGACARYLTERSKSHHMFDAIFLPGNSSANIRDGSAFFSPKEHAIADAVFGKGPKDATKMGAAVYKAYGIGEKGFNISSCQFALHYFFENGTTFTNFLRNLSENTAPGGHFIATCYDGDTVFNMLRNKKRDESVAIYVNGNRDKIFEIVKQYDQTGFTDDETSLGYPINVFQESINKYAVEFLVNYEFFRRSMENYGFAVISDEEAKDYGFEKGSGMFSDLFQSMKRDIMSNPASQKWYENASAMTEEEKKISFLNRYFIFKKTHNVNTAKVEKIVALTDKELDKMLELDEEKKIEEAKKDLALKPDEKPVQKKERKPRAKKIKTAEKVQLEEFKPIEDEEELVSKDVEDMREAMEVGEVVVPAALLQVTQADFEPKEPEETKEQNKEKETNKSEEPKEIGVKVAAKERCPKGTKRYAPVGPDCYTQEEIDAWQAARKNKTKKNKEK